MNGRPLIVGAGPTGLAAALFLSAKGITPRVVDQAAEPARESRALVVNPRVLELLEPTGVTEAMLAEGRPVLRTRFYDGWDNFAEIGFADVHPRYHMTVLPQARSEAILAAALAQRGIEPERSTRFVAIRIARPGRRRDHGQAGARRQRQRNNAGALATGRRRRP